MKAKPTDFLAVVSEAVADIVDRGFDAKRVETWQKRIKAAAVASLTPIKEVDQALRDGLTQEYERIVVDDKIIRQSGVSRSTLENRIKPKLRKLLQQRIAGSANLIKLKRETNVSATLSRFAGWASSVPPGGSDAQNKKKTKADISRALKSLDFEDRRLLIDQGHKLVANINEVIAEGGDAIAAQWHSMWRQPGYDYREEHKEFDGRVFLLRGSWAEEKGLVRPGNNGYYGEGTEKVAEKPFCRCTVKWIYHLRDLPADMLTAKGRAELARVRAALQK